ncbi:MAG TPA: efflux RND transporter periplasmic adaptor subunit [Steroidobacteraceae bacterium]|nr:efflux RND transporter periplasmic adaptor subunit [Steroidobacteraceae bacterium]
MKRSHIILAAGAVSLLAVGAWLLAGARKSDASPYRLAAVERGDLEATVSSTGALSAVTTVQVGTQVSGKVVAIHADFNDRVKMGELIAQIDPVVLQQAVQDAQAGLERSQAELAQTSREYQRNKLLFERKVLTEIDFNTAKYAFNVAQTNVKSAQVSLDRAKLNLGYSNIYAPIDGVVVERDVDVGQTVAASLSAPQLFLIANDLSQMQILASVDESDIGAIHEGQSARFTVQAYPNETFTGAVKQVRLQSKTTENVVNYTVVVSVANPGGKLLPGMTATIDFLTGSAKNVLLVPNAALRFRPTEEMRAQMRKKFAGARGGASDPNNPDAQLAAAAGRAVGSATPRNPAAAGSRPRNALMLWYVDDKGEPAVTRVRTGLSDGQRTEVSGKNLKEGMQAIVGVTQTAPTTAASSPFQPQTPTQQPRRPGGF